MAVLAEGNSTPLTRNTTWFNGLHSAPPQQPHGALGSPPHSRPSFFYSFRRRAGGGGCENCDQIPENISRMFACVCVCAEVPHPFVQWKLNGRRSVELDAKPDYIIADDLAQALLKRMHMPFFFHWVLQTEKTGPKRSLTSTTNAVALPLRLQSQGHHRSRHICTAGSRVGCKKNGASSSRRH